MSAEYDTMVGELCSCRRGVCLYWCVDCAWVSVICRECLVTRHVYCPFHWAEEWTGSFFWCTSFSVIGLKIYLGHSGESCLNVASQGYSIQVTDVNSTHAALVVYCACVDRDEPVIQLLKHSLFPTLVKHPDSAFMFHMLCDFHILSTAAKTSAYNYMECVCRKTNNTIPSKAKVGHCLFSLFRVH